MKNLTISFVKKTMVLIWKRIFFNRSNLFFFLIGIIFLWTQLPLFINNLEKEGMISSPRSYALIAVPGVSENIIFPPQDAKVITIFWATWCGPCKVEMKRLQASIKSGRIKKSEVYAINPFESKLEIYRFLKNNKYSFTFLDASQIAAELNVTVTPTTLFFNKGKVTSMRSGMSITGIWEAEFFLKD